MGREWVLDGCPRCHCGRDDVEVLAVHKSCPAPSPIFLPPPKSNSGKVKFAGYGPCSLSPDIHLLLRPISSTHRTAASRFHCTASVPLRIFFITLPRRCGSLTLHRRGFFYTCHTHLAAHQGLPKSPKPPPNLPLLQTTVSPTTFSQTFLPFPIKPPQPITSVLLSKRQPGHADRFQGLRKGTGVSSSPRSHDTLLPPCPPCSPVRISLLPSCDPCSH